MWELANDLSVDPDIHQKALPRRRRVRSIRYNILYAKGTGMLEALGPIGGDRTAISNFSHREDQAFIHTTSSRSPFARSRPSC